jgi:hypothetical protein
MLAWVSPAERAVARAAVVSQCDIDGDPTQPDLVGLRELLVRLGVIVPANQLRPQA